MTILPSVTSSIGRQAIPQGVMPLAQRIAQAVAMGTVAMPDSSDSSAWQQLIDDFQSNGGPVPGTSAPRLALTSPTTGLAGVATTTAPSAGTSPETGPDGLNAFLSAIKQHESGGDYTAYNSAGGASGAYQFIQSTWSNAAKEAGYSDYATGPASAAPPQVQDAVAGHMASSYYQHYGSWQDAAEAWYEPADVGKDVVPAQTAGNTESVTGYGQQIVQMMGKYGGSTGKEAVGVVDRNAQTSGSSNAAVSWAMGQIGVPYQWGGESPGKDFDCSGLVQATYSAVGVKLPRVAQTQYDATSKLPANAQLQPGDLLFFGKSTSAITHVGIYVGNGKMIDAPHTGANVRVETYKWGDFVGATRPTDPGAQSALPATAPPSAPAQPTATPTRGMSRSRYYQALSQVQAALVAQGAHVGGAR